MPQLNHVSRLVTVMYCHCIVAIDPTVIDNANLNNAVSRQNL